jgi:hypothetical protein
MGSSRFEAHITWEWKYKHSKRPNAHDENMMERFGRYAGVWWCQMLSRFSFGELAIICFQPRQTYSKEESVKIRYAPFASQETRLSVMLSGNVQQPMMFGEEPG